MLYLNLIAYIIPEISTVIRTTRQTDMILIMNKYTLYGQKLFLLHTSLTYFLTNLVYST